MSSDTSDRPADETPVYSGYDASGSVRPTATPATPPGSPRQVAPKVPAAAVACSMILPGVGTLTNGETAKGAAFVLLYLAGAAILLATGNLVGPAVMAVVWVWAAYDAFHGAQEWNRRRGIES